MTTPLVELREVSQTFARGKGRTPLRALDAVSLEVRRGATVALVGESGSGKTTLGRTVLGLAAPTAGAVLVDGADVYDRDRAARARARAGVQVVFQHPSSSLDPTMRIDQIVCEPLRSPRLRGRAARVRAQALLERVGLRPEYAARRPFELSGGEQQRVAIARAIAAEPELIVLDEPTSSIDFAARRDILRLLAELQRDGGLTYLFITHDLVSATYLAPETVVLYAGRIVERGPTAEVLERPRHPYTKVLIQSALTARPGVRPSIVDAPAVREERSWGACAFRERCPLRSERCDGQAPELRRLADGHDARCFHAEQVTGVAEAKVA